MKNIEFKEYDNMTKEEMYSLVNNVYSESVLENAALPFFRKMESATFIIR